MKSSLLNIIVLTGRIILPAILCALLIAGVKQYTNYEFLLIFGIVIILVNYSKTKYYFLLSFFISVILSYIVFFTSIVIYFGIGYIIMGGDLDRTGDMVVLGININKLLLLIPVAVISPLLMFYSYNILFKTEKTSYFIFIKWASVVVLILLGIISDFYDDGYMYIYWQVTMVLALQLILYQTELKALFKPKKEK